ncbi:site-specific integrase [Rheinheimera soli]|uniref:site-specific integrase n=1 Tax=Rheinheimera soli TaxID=443616 RepID=UPI001E34CAFD|nr:site-specific integrase [Rheinheimera soli]
MKPTEYKGIYAGENSFRIDFMFQCVRCRETIRATPNKTRLKEAARKLDQIKYEIDMGTFDYAKHFPTSPRAFKFSTNKAAYITISKAVDDWFRRNSKNWAASTYRGYWSKVKTHILPNFGNLTAFEFKPSLFNDWAARTEVSPKTVNEVRTILSGIFKELVYDEIIDQNPIDKCRPASRRAKEPEPFNGQERSAILAALPDGAARDFYTFAFWTGLRTGEKLGLRWQDVDFEKQRIYIRQTIVNGRTAQPKTLSSVRTHHLHPTALAILQKIQSYHPDLHPDSRVFLDPRTMLPWENDGIPRERFWTFALEQAKVKYRCPYTCRHTYASTMLTAKEDPSWIAKQMGHKDWGMIRRVYARWID